MKKAIAILLTALLLLTVFVSCEGDVEDLFGDNITITFNGNGSTGGQMAALKVARGKEVRLTANAYEKTDNEFIGWNTKADGSGYKYKDEQFVYFEEDTTLYAQWSSGVTITFDANDGSGTMNPVKIFAGVYKLPENGFTPPEGCAFVRWSETADGEVEYEVGDELEVTEDVTLYAIWAQVLSTTPGEINGRYTITANTDINNRFGASGTLKLYLLDGKTLNAKRGITVTDGNTLVIDKVGTKGNGTLLIDGVGYNFAGIGGGENQAGGIITINGGTVIATGGSDAAGIGGGFFAAGGTITITGGEVTATGGIEAAGIGGGVEGAGGKITISGGTVTANGGETAAGIGGGNHGVGGTISISGGTVTATGGEYAAGIGGGSESNGGTVKINGGTVTSNGGETAAGIGGGCYGNGGKVTINGGTVTATGGSANGYYGPGAGIGGGYNGAGGTVAINGGTVTANGGESAAGIGAGNVSSDHGTLTIGAGCALTGGSAYADTLLLGPVDSETTYTGDSHPRYMNVSTVSEIKDSTSAITLKSGVYTTDKTDTEVTVSERITVEGSVFLLLPDGKKLTASEGITVSSGNTLVIDKYGSTATGTGILNATGPDDSAGIGGVDGAGGTVTINGGIVTATGGEDAAGIGGGEGGNGGTVTINGGTVTANGGVNAAGIGGGVDGDGGTVTINGGTVTANGGGYAAGIGGGVEGDGGTVTINGGTVTATGGENTEAGIGAGTNRSSHGKLTIGYAEIQANSLVIKSGWSLYYGNSENPTVHVDGLHDANDISDYVRRYMNVTQP